MSKTYHDALAVFTAHPNELMGFSTLTSYVARHAGRRPAEPNLRKALASLLADGKVERYESQSISLGLRGVRWNENLTPKAVEDYSTSSQVVTYRLASGLVDRDSFVADRLAMIEGKRRILNDHYDNRLPAVVQDGVEKLRSNADRLEDADFLDGVSSYMTVLREYQLVMRDVNRLTLEIAELEARIQAASEPAEAPPSSKVKDSRASDFRTLIRRFGREQILALRPDLVDLED